MNIPDQITQGETKTWKDDPFTDNIGNALSAPAYTLTYALRGPTAINSKYGVDLVATADGEGFSTTVTTAQSTDLLGRYDFVAFVQKGSDATTRVVVGTGIVTVLKNLALINPATTAYDGRSQLEKDIEAVDTAITARANGSTPLKYTIGTRQLENEPIRELIALRAELRRRLVKQRQQETINNGGGDPRSVTARFRSPH
jgi:hypothetical protein